MKTIIVLSHRSIHVLHDVNKCTFYGMELDISARGRDYTIIAPFCWGPKDISGSKYQCLFDEAIAQYRWASSKAGRRFDREMKRFVEELQAAALKEQEQGQRQKQRILR